MGIVGYRAMTEAEITEFRNRNSVPASVTTMQLEDNTTILVDMIAVIRGNRRFSFMPKASQDDLLRSGITGVYFVLPPVPIWQEDSTGIAYDVPATSTTIESSPSPAGLTTVPDTLPPDGEFRIGIDDPTRQRTFTPEIQRGTDPTIQVVLEPEVQGSANQLIVISANSFEKNYTKDSMVQLAHDTVFFRNISFVDVAVEIQGIGGISYTPSSFTLSRARLNNIGVGQGLILPQLGGGQEVQITYNMAEINRLSEGITTYQTTVSVRVVGQGAVDIQPPVIYIPPVLTYPVVNPPVITPPVITPPVITPPITFTPIGPIITPPDFGSSPTNGGASVGTPSAEDVDGNRDDNVGSGDRISDL